MMEKIDQRFGNYRLHQLLSKGTFADVYLGEHLYLNTPVAIKVLRSKIDSPTLARFLNEARLVSQLVHPHIIRVFDFGLESEAPFLVMDYAPYGNLRELHPSGSTVPLSTIVSYTMALASALQCAHDQHLVHRDLKPENVLLGSKHEVLLSDCGLALLTSDQELLQVKERFGTLAYMAPELILGQPVPASDQYALAVLVYEWLCGHLPFSGSSVHISNQQLYIDPPSLCEKHPEISRAMEKVVLKGLSKEPEQRFVDVLSFARAFEEVCNAFTSANMRVNLSSSPLFESGLHQDDLHLRFQDVPFPLTSLIGRDMELHSVRDLLLRQEVRLVTLTGTGGIGKTQLALALGNALHETFVDGVSFVYLASIYDSELVIPAIAQSLGLKEGGILNPMQLLKAFLREKQLLLILDNFEQVLLAAPLLTELLTSCSRLKILVTSRAVLHVWGEHLFRVQPLEIPDLQQEPDLESLFQVASVALFVQCTRAIYPTFQLSDENARDVAELCARLEGMPLALELASEQCKVFSPHALLSRLKHPLDILTGGRRDAPPRHQTLRNMLSWNDDVLSPDEQRLFRRLAIFDGGFSLQAVEEIMCVVGEVSISVLDGIAALLDKSMLQHTNYGEEEPRLFIFEMLREYGLEQLTVCGELEQTRDAHASYFMALAEGIVCHLDHTIWHTKLQRDECNLRAAVEWLLEKGERGSALRIAAALEKISQAYQEEHVLLPIQGNANLLGGAIYQVIDQFDFDSTDIHFEQNKRTQRRHRDHQEVVINLNFVDATSPQRHYRVSASTELLSSSAYKELTTREIEVLRLLAMGLSNKQIAERLVLSPHTVSGHIQSIFGKLALNSRSAATRFALEHHLA
ncbi:MAG: protein kinase domain-containing protein [Ktedonobacteraceae bacterium]